MIVLIIQTVLIPTIAFIVGCVTGSVLRRLMGSEAADAPVEVAPKAPRVPKPPMPAAPARPVTPVAAPPAATPAVGKVSKSKAKTSAKSKTETAAKTSTRAAQDRARAPAKNSAAGKGDAAGTKPKVLAKARGGKADNLTLIDGVGSAIEAKMLKLGVFHFDQIAAMSKDELAWLGEAVGFPGRPERENWAKESRALAANGVAKPAPRAKRGQIKASRKS